MTMAMQLRADTAQLTKLLRRGVQASFLGMFLSTSGDPLEDTGEHFEELYVETRSNTIKAFQYAQELFSLFILALASEVKSVDKQAQPISPDEDSTIDEQNPTETTAEKKKVPREHPVFRDIAKIITEKGLAQSMAEAYVLIIPAFAKYDLLPKDEEQQSSTPTDNQYSADFPMPL
ncbi:hypothetical protein K4K60_004181 [Colletotrichum sp. SAR11_57]|nr:hypothetical protein K4K60_004181 [Colletotrichum sp. SAR11_57]